MKDNKSMAQDFINDAFQLYQEQAKLFSGSFDKKMVASNIELIKRKRYAITDSIWRIKEKENKKFLRELLAVIMKNSPDFKKEIDALTDVLESGDTAGEIILSILQNRFRDLTGFIRQHGLTNEFFTLFSLFAAYQYRNSVMSYVKDSHDFTSHHSGLCPVCGHWPGVAYIIGETGTRLMSCICCGAQWNFKRLRCSFCLTSDKEHLSYLNIDGEETVSAYTCDTCRRYIKTVKVDGDAAGITGERALTDYLSSGLIDIAALQNKYVQESLLVTKFSGPEDDHLDAYINLLTE